MTDRQKRQHLKTIGLAGMGLSLWSLNGCSSVTALTTSASDAADAVLWQQADAIIASIAPTQFAKRDFVVTEFGAKATAEFDSSMAINAAIAACAAAGGGQDGGDQAQGHGPTFQNLHTHSCGEIKNDRV